MPNTKNYVDSDALQYFLGKLKNAYSTGASGFTVMNATNATNATYATYAAGDSTTIKSTYLTIENAAAAYMPIDATFAGQAIGDLTGGGKGITKENLLTGLNVTEGAEPNVITGVATSNGDTVTVTSKVATIDMSGYAKTSDISAAMHFMGAVNFYSNLADVASPAKGDVWLVRYKGTSGTDPYGEEFICTDPTANPVAWEPLGPVANLDGYATQDWVSNNYVSKTSYNSDQELVNDALSGLRTDVNRIYTPASGQTAASGLLVDETTRATNAETGLGNRLTTLEGDVSTTGSARKIAKDTVDTALAGLTAAAGSNKDFVSEVTQSNGQVTVTRGNWSQIASGAGTPPTAGAVYTYVGDAISTAFEGKTCAQTGDSTTASYVKVVSQANGQVSATAGAFDTSIPASNPSNITAPTTAAVKTYADSVAVYDAASGGNQITAMVPISTDTIDGWFSGNSGS